MKHAKKKIIKNIASIDTLRKLYPEAEAKIDLANKFPLKDPMEIITKTSGWQIVKKVQITNKGMASFVRQ